MNYQFDPELAKNADVFFSKIEHSGSYTGVFTRAEQVKSKKGTVGIEFSFKADTGENANYLSIWTHNAEGKAIHGYSTLMAIMACFRCQSLAVENGEVEKFDDATKKRVKVSVPLFKGLMNKPINLLIQMEEYVKNSGGTGWKANIILPFDKGGFTASEIVAKATTPILAAKILATLKDKPLKVSVNSNAFTSDNSENPAHGMDNTFNFNDDIPF